MDIKSIVEYDAKYNNGVDNGYEIFMSLVTNGFDIYKTDNTVFIYTKDNQNSVRYHSIHNGTIKELIKAYEKFFAHIKNITNIAYTTVTNLKLNALAKRYFQGVIEIDGNVYTTKLRN